MGLKAARTQPRTGAASNADKERFIGAGASEEPEVSPTTSPTSSAPRSVPGAQGHPRVKQQSSVRLTEPMHQQLVYVAEKSGYRSTHSLVAHLIKQEVDQRLQEDGYTLEEIRAARGGE